MKKSILFILTLALLPVFAFGQQFKPAPELTTTESAEMQSYDLKIMALLNKYQKKMAPEMQRIQDDRKAWLLKLSQAHPGYQWHDSTGPADPSGLRVIVAPSQPAPAPIPPVNELDKLTPKQ